MINYAKFWKFGKDIIVLSWHIACIGRTLKSGPKKFKYLYVVFIGCQINSLLHVPFSVTSMK